MKRLEFIIKLVAISILSGLVTCEKETSNNQNIYFEYYYINYAWGLQYLHWVIDNEGNVLISRNVDSIIWIKEDGIDKYISFFDSVVYKVDLKELIYYIDLIPSAAKGQIICEDRNRADFGGTVFNCFYNDKVILLSSMSDIEDCSNKNMDAIRIDNWLKNIHTKIYSKN
jgi:hypothetical protein